MSKKYLSAIVFAGLLIALVAQAEPVSKNDLVGTGFTAEQASVLATMDTTNLDIDTTLDSAYVGDNAGDSITTGNHNVGVGDDAGTALTSGATNVLVGANAGKALATGSDSVCVGDDACLAHAGTASVVVIGANAMDASTAGSEGGVCIGEDACGDAATFAGADTIAIGQGAAGDVTTGAENIFIGGDAGATATTAANNIGIGHTALGSTGAKSGADNIAIGEDSLKLVTSDTDNIAIGSLSGDAIVGGGNSNVLIGSGAGGALTTGDGNVCIGDEACALDTTHGKSVMIGFEVGKSAIASAGNLLAIDNNDDATPLISGNFDTHALTFNAAGDVTIAGGTLIQTEVNFVPAYLGKQGATATVGWVVTGKNVGLATLAASATADTLVIPITGLNIGDTIVSYKVVGQFENTADDAGTIFDADLRKVTNAAAGGTDASIGAITQVAPDADAAIASSKTLATPEVIASGEVIYLLVKATTGANSDVELVGVELTVTKGN